MSTKREGLGGEGGGKNAVSRGTIGQKSVLLSGSQLHIVRKELSGLGSGTIEYRIEAG